MTTSIPSDASAHIRSRGIAFGSVVALVVGLLALYAPTLRDLMRDVWSTDRNSHGPIVLGLTVWLFYLRGGELAVSGIDLIPRPAVGFAWAIFGLALYVMGRSQDLLLFEVGSAVPLLLGVVIALLGVSAARHFWFAYFFLLFAIPLPESLVDAVTQPLKIGVSIGSEAVLNAMGYAVARSGVILYVGNYQLLVADACAGLNSLFTLEALGLLYLNVVKQSSAFRNIALALLIVPISFSANVTRVVTLALITYHLGDEAGQGFLHGFSGMVLFMTALMLIIGVDSALRVLARRLGRAPS